MDDDEDDLNHFHSTEPKSIVEQQDNQKTTFSKEREKLTSSNRRRIRVKFAYSFDNDRVLPITKTTVIKTEPCFKVIATEDQVAKLFYQNKSKEYKKTQFVEQRTISEPDSLEDEYLPPQLDKRKETTPKIPFSSPLKSILKKPQKKEEIPKRDQSLKSRSPSPSSKNKQISTPRLDFNEVQHLAEITAKQNLSSPSIYSRSLFDQTINIFDPNNSSRITSTTPRSSRLQYYIKPYRGDPELSTNKNKQRSRSLPRQLERTNRWDTFSNQHIQPSTRKSNRKQYILWSPSRDFTYDEREPTIIIPTKKKKTSSSKTSSPSLSINPSLSLSNPCLRNLPTAVSVSVPYRPSQFFSPPLSTDLYYTPSIIDRPLTPLTTVSQYNYNKGEKESMLKSHSPDEVYPHKKEHDETIQRYDRLLEKMRTTDEQLQSLSRSWMNNTQQKTPVNMDRRSTLSLNKMTNESHFFSPLIVQMCLIILIIFNLLVVYFFHEINVWWSENIAPGMIMEPHKENILNI